MFLAWLIVALTGAVVVPFLLAVGALLRRCPVLQARAWPKETPAPPVTVIIPARNEAHVLEGCARAVLAQRYPNFEIIIVDDASEDATGEIARGVAAKDRRCRVLNGRPLEPGWLGKNNALVHGVAHARGDYLLFVDADTLLAPEAITSSVLEMGRRDLAFLSLWPYQKVRGLLTSPTQSVMVGLALFADAIQRLAGPPFPVALSAWGTFIMVKADDYALVGGHESVRSAVNEDHALGQRFREAGLATAMLQGTKTMSVTMYARLPDLWSGWTKNLFANLRSSYALSIGAAALVLLLTCGATAGVIVGAWLGMGWVVALSLGLAGLQLAAGAIVGRHVSTAWPLVLSPFGGLVAATLYLTSAFNAATKRGVVWKGRRVQADVAR